MKIIFIDTETTGLNSQKHDIIQLAGLVVEDGKVIDSFNYKCQPVNWTDISPQALQVNNTTYEQLHSYETPKESFVKFLVFISTYRRNLVIMTFHFFGYGDNLVLVNNRCFLLLW